MYGKMEGKYKHNVLYGECNVSERCQNDNRLKGTRFIGMKIATV